MHSLKMRLTISGTVGVVALNLVLGGLIGGVILIWKLAVALWYQELAEQYAIPNLGKCPFHQKGQVLYSDGINPPDGMCGVAWQVIAPMARQLSLGELVQPSGTWLNDDTIGVVACPDGIRPVIFCWRLRIIPYRYNTKKVEGASLIWETPSTDLFGLL